MNRMQPCEVCGCPVLFHSARPTPEGGPQVRVCPTCTKANGREQVCGPAPP